jgi:hypothetical protein
MSRLNRIASKGTQICLVISTFQKKGKGVLQKQFASLSCNKKVTKNQVVLSCTVPEKLSGSPKNSLGP